MWGNIRTNKTNFTWHTKNKLPIIMIDIWTWKLLNKHFTKEYYSFKPIQRQFMLYVHLNNDYLLNYAITNNLKILSIQNVRVLRSRYYDFYEIYYGQFLFIRKIMVFLENEIFCLNYIFINNPKLNKP